ncbi:hypothetical protein Asppvi_006038 [Aspergillus pseudoviridinutans]|uniref:Zn(2)-C6 fungal-type domain-containing protein n=1 Tax=Aspergillus pseudoviridinutans TaxID=1517512 RepID=A0A9P3BFU3_9EURO|nr:uncharacterized protein Asppvi_006038 [Aspergillus pseudoviridinutans]GIJ87134.1 hypothetical protein Asppvi_006038 [Aspergillus pseudoviridinutans]
MDSADTNSSSQEPVNQLPRPSSSSGQQLSVILRRKPATLSPATKLPIPRSGSTPISRQRTPRACEVCRERKTKCDGSKPICKQCRVLKIACAYSGSKHEKQQLAIECARVKIKVYESVLRRIYEECRNEGRTSIEETFHRHFRASPEIFSSFLSSQSPFEQQPSPPKPGLSLHRMHMAWARKNGNRTPHLCQEPQIWIKGIRAWTSLVDDEVASHLLSLYFAWENPIWQLVDQHLFLRDLASGSKRFCSPLLVHALLFFGCSYSYNLDRITDRQEEKSLGKRLYAEIQHLWQTEKGQLNLPIAQSSILIGLLFCTLGIDRLGTKYILHGAEVCHKLDLHCKSPAYLYSNADRDELGPISRCHKLVAWAVFDVQALAAQVYRKMPVWEHPPAVCFSLDEAAVLDEGTEWSPYPFRFPVQQPFYYTAACYRSALVMIVHEIAIAGIRFSKTGISRDDWQYARQLHQKLCDWMRSLPSCAMPQSNTTPHILCLHLYFQATLVFLGDMFILYSKATRNDESNLAWFDPWTVKSRALDAVGSLILRYKQHHGWKSIPIVFLHYFCLAGVHAISQIKPQEPKWSLILESCVVGLWHMSLGWGRLCTAFLRTIELVLKASKPGESLIPTKVAVIFEQLDTTLWSATDISSLSADYVVHHVPTRTIESAAGSEFKAEGLENLIRSMDHLSIG